MKPFIIKFFGFTLTVFLILTVPVEIMDELTDAQDIFLIPNETEYLILGNSRPECALNTDFIDKAFNFSKSAEPYFYTLIKSKKLMEENDLDNLKAVFIQYSLVNVSKDRDAWIWDQSNLQSNYPKYYHVMTPKELKVLFQRNFEGLLAIHLSQTFIRQARNYFFRTPIERTKYYGSYRPNFKIYTPRPVRKTKLQLEDNSIHEKSLQQIIQLFNNVGIKVYLISCPIHPTKYQEEKDFPTHEYLKKNNIQAELLDFSNFPLSDDMFADRSHLNYFGAKEFSLFFNDLLKSGLLDKKNKQTFIDLQEKEIKIESQKRIYPVEQRFPIGLVSPILDKKQRT